MDFDRRQSQPGLSVWAKRWSKAWLKQGNFSGEIRRGVDQDARFLRVLWPLLPQFSAPEQGNAKNRTGICKLLPGIAESQMVRICASCGQSFRAGKSARRKALTWASVSSKWNESYWRICSSIATFNRAASVSRKDHKNQRRCGRKPVGVAHQLNVICGGINGFGHLRKSGSPRPGSQDQAANRRVHLRVFGFN